MGTSDAILNVLLFIPLGFGLALSGMSGWRVVLVVFALSTLIESAQLVAVGGRNATVGDVFTNTFGGTLGFAIGRYRMLWLRPRARLAKALLLGWATLWMVIQIVSNYGFALSLPRSRYYGQIARSLGNFAVFPGRVLTAGVGETPIPDGPLDSRVFTDGSVRKGSWISTTIVSSEAPRGIAPIVRIADADRDEILLLAQDDNRFVFSIRTGASVVRLRRPHFGLPNVFSSGSAGNSLLGDTSTLAAQHSPSAIRLQAHSSGKTRDRVVIVSAALGWTLLLPFTWLIQGTAIERALSLVWVGFLTVPLGYWAAAVHPFSLRRSPYTRWAVAVIVGISFLSGGLIFIPHVFGLSAAPLGDWAAAVAGVALGYRIGADQRRRVPVSHRGR